MYSNHQNKTRQVKQWIQEWLEFNQIREMMKLPRKSMQTLYYYDYYRTLLVDMEDKDTE
jgi:hypothetical protein